MPNETILITGSSGTIGTALAEDLLADGYTVHGVDLRSNRWSSQVDERTTIADLRSLEAIDELPTDVDIVVHLAAHARVHKLVEKPKLAQDNFDMTFAILEYARRNEVPKVVFGSSREVYGNNQKIIYDEEDTYVDECESPYTASKIGSEAMTKSYQNCYGIDSCILRFSNVYGRYDASDRVVPLFIAKSNENQDLVVFGDNKILDFTYLDDCVDGIRSVIENFGKAKYSTFNIASGEGKSLIELATLIREELGSQNEIHVEDTRTGEVSKYVADISKAKTVLGYSPQYSLAEGVNATIRWYDKNASVQEEILAESSQ